MTAEQAIGKAYEKLLQRATKKDTPLYEGKTSEVGHFGISFNFARALQTNRKDQAEYYRTMFLNGFMSLNEVRGELALPKLDDEIGDQHFIQLSYNTVENIVNGVVNVGNQKYNQEPSQTKVVKDEQ